MAGVTAFNPPYRVAMQRMLSRPPRERRLRRPQLHQPAAPAGHTGDGADRGTADAGLET